MLSVSLPVSRLASCSCNALVHVEHSLYNLLLIMLPLIHIKCIIMQSSNVEHLFIKLSSYNAFSVLILNTFTWHLPLSVAQHQKCSILDAFLSQTYHCSYMNTNCRECKRVSPVLLQQPGNDGVELLPLLLQAVVFSWHRRDVLLKPPHSNTRTLYVEGVIR